MRTIKVDDIKRPLKKGEFFLVPCIVRYEELPKDEEHLWLDLNTPSKTKIYISPVINHPHNDLETGQTEVHYHLDYRFIKHRDNGNFPSIIRNHSLHFFGENIRPTLNNGHIVYYKLPVVNEDYRGVTPSSLIKNVALKRNYIKDFKCPHKGYDLRQVEAKNGIITCPLHGLNFCSNTKKIISDI